MGQFEPTHWIERRQRSSAKASGRARWGEHGHPRSEFTARPPGRLGRRLLAEVDAYLAFFAFARAHADEQ